MLIDNVDVKKCEFYREEINGGNYKMATCKDCGFCIENIKLKPELITENIPRCLGKYCGYKYKKFAEKKEREIKQLKLKIEKALNILMAGRTFYTGYFDNYEQLGRQDKAIYELIKGK